jgi:ubiquinone/menaquinone biosynthesis C-methylase UbiE
MLPNFTLSDPDNPSLNRTFSHHQKASALNQFSVLPPQSTSHQLSAMASASNESGNPFPTQAEMQSHFSRVAKDYDKSASEITGKICRHILTLLDPPISSTSIVHDNGCGPGVMTRNIIETLSPDMPEIHATDLSSAMIEVLNGKGLQGVDTGVMDCQELRFPDGMFTHSICTFVIFAVPDAVKAAKQMYRTLQPGGIVAVTTWEDVGWVAPHKLAQKRIRPDEDWLGPLPAEWTTEEKLRGVLEGGGFENVEVSRDSAGFTLEDMWAGLKEMNKMASKQITKGWSEGEKERFEAVLEE